MNPVIWLVILIVLLVIEVITLGLSTIWFAGGALASFIAALAGANVAVQVVLFLAVSIILLLFTRPCGHEIPEQEQDGYQRGQSDRRTGRRHADDQ